MFSLYSSALKATTTSAAATSSTMCSPPSLKNQYCLATSSTPTPALPNSIIFTTSGLGGCLGWAVVHPFNTIAVRSNLASASGQTFALSEMLKKQGFMSLYDGLSAGVARQVFYATSRFGLFETFRDILHEYRGKTDFAARLFYGSFIPLIIILCISVGVGAVTGGIAAYLSCPMEVCVVRMSNDSSLPIDERRNYKSLWDTASRITKEEGITAFWRGSNPFVARAMMVGVFQVATLDQFKHFYADLLHQRLNSISNVFCAAMTSGLIYAVATMPLEAAKNRMASQKRDPVTGKLPFTGTFQTISKVASEKGFMTLYNGFFPYYLRCGGHTVSMFIIVQVLRDAYIMYAM